jgi:hypothetical protein
MRKEGSQMKSIVTVIFVLLLVCFARAQSTWIRTYGGMNDDEGWFVQQTTDGGYIITGATYSFGDTSNGDVYLIKTNSSGDTIWTRTYGGAGMDGGYCVRQTTDGGYIITGYTYSFNDTALGDVYLIKTNAFGDTIWTRSYGGTSYDKGYSVRQTSDSGYIVAGYTWSFGAGEQDVYLIKTNASGDTLWTRTYGGKGIDGGYCVQQTTDGGYIITGNTHSFGAGNYDVWLIKTDASGDTLWTKTYGGTSEDDGYCVQQTTDGGYIITGMTKSFGAGNADVYLIKTNASGDTLWTRTYGGTNYDQGNSVQQTPDSGYIIAGYTWSFGAGNQEVYLIKTDASGDTLWTRTYGGAGNSLANSVQRTADGGYIIAGTTDDFGPSNADVYLIKTDSNGNAGVEEPGSSRQPAAGSFRATPNPFAAFTRIPGHESERFDVYDVAGKMVGKYWGNRIGAGLSPTVYFARLDDKHDESLRIVKVR